MFETLETAISELRVPCDPAALVHVLALKDRLDARISEAVGEIDHEQLWDLDGYVSMTSWLKQKAQMTAAEAARTAHTASRLRELSVTRKAWVEGRLSGGQVAAVLAAVRPEHRELFADHEADLVPSLGALDVRDTCRVMRRWSEMAEALIEPDEAPQRRRSLRASRLLDDRVILDGDLDSDSGEVVLSALRLAESPDDDDEIRTPSERRADALADICRYFLDHQRSQPGGRHRPHVNVVVDADDLYTARRARYMGGAKISAETASAILCDSVMHRMVVDPAGAIIDYGRATRTISAPLWAALVVRDAGCRFPGCDRPPNWCEAHHVVWFRDGGTTCPENLVLLCSRHHHKLHEGGWHAKLLPDATFEVTAPGGFVQTTGPPLAVMRS